MLPLFLSESVNLGVASEGLALLRDEKPRERFRPAHLTAGLAYSCAGVSKEKGQSSLLGIHIVSSLVIHTETRRSSLAWARGNEKETS